MSGESGNWFSQDFLRRHAALCAIPHSKNWIDGKTTREHCADAVSVGGGDIGPTRNPPIPPAITLLDIVAVAIQFLRERPLTRMQRSRA
ncbi:MAG: hypothetical protein HY056_02225 [Proteobacteria bacterium]|nr:hypothetical protein [Pseudomonadota bacterium]